MDASQRIPQKRSVSLSLSLISPLKRIGNDGRGRGEGRNLGDFGRGGGRKLMTFLAAPNSSVTVHRFGRQQVCGSLSSSLLPSSKGRRKCRYCQIEGRQEGCEGMCSCNAGGSFYWVRIESRCPAASRPAGNEIHATDRLRRPLQSLHRLIAIEV